MSDAARLDPATVGLQGTLLVEASAGTGKTWTIGALVLRLVLEEGLALPELLVLTFTEAATAELRDRLRARLETACRELTEEDRGSTSPALERARRALASFDEASIFTIHAFCRRVLSERPLALGLPPLLEPGETASATLLEVARDRLRRRREELDPGFLDWLAGLKGGLLTPESWVELAMQAHRHPDAEIPAPADEAELRAALVQRSLAHRDAAAAARRAMEETSPEELATLIASSGLKQNIYQPRTVARELAEMWAWLEQGAPVEGCGTTGKYCPGRLAETKVLRKNGAPPSHLFFGALEQLVEREEQLLFVFRGLLTHLQLQALRDWPRQAEALRRERRQPDFGDLLSGVRDGLAGPGGAALAAQLRQRWRAALVDEYQDTDPVQAEIFQRLFAQAGLPLVLVGDPKQAIYGFRGADLHAYLAAARQAGRRAGLGVNWRSDPGHVRAVGRLFAAERFPAGAGVFLHGEIQAPALQASRTTPERRLLLDGRQLADLSVLHLEEAPTRGRGGRLVCRHVATLVARLLRPTPGTHTGWDSGPDGALVPVQGREIAVLARTNAQGEALAAALAEAGVACARIGDASVWRSREAVELERLLAALARPHDLRAARALLAGPFALALGMRPAEALLDPAALERLQEALHAAAARARQSGLAAALAWLTEELRLPETLLGLRLGERRLVNWRHLLDLLRREESAARMESAELARRVQQRRRSRQRDEDAELRLESEENLVRVVTLHRCKGLEFPLVFCPFLWAASGREESFGAQLLHDDAGRARLAPHGAHAPLADADAAEAGREALAEELRLAYVGLTRARNHTLVHSVMTGARSWRRPSALHWLLLGPRLGDEPPLDKERWKALVKEGPALLRTAWEGVVATAEGTIELLAMETVAPAVVPMLVDSSEETPAARPFTGHMASGCRVSSFTSLMTGIHEDERLDEWFGRADEAGEDSEPTAADWKARFPRGARAGQCLHELLQELDFRTVDHAPLLAPCRAALLRHGLDGVLAEGTARWLLEILDTPLEGGAFRLRDLPASSRAAELDFHLRTRGLEAARLEDLLRRHGVPEAALLARRGVPEGWLKGYIDLCHEWEGRWWVLDWKSNHLGLAADYIREAMAAEMARSGYLLQALLYLTALHRHLRGALPGYAPERHLGGLRYLFLRGLDPTAPGRGVYEERPPLALILELDGLLGGER